MDSPPSSSQEINQDLIPALIKCFGIIFIGYMFGRLQIIPKDVKKGLGLYVQHLALPVLLFKLVATISFKSVKWEFVASVFVAKTIIFFVVALITMIIVRPIHVGKAGLYAITATQSNDFALGYPLLVSLYQHTHSNYASFLYLTAPLQVLVLNPVGFFMMEIHKEARDDSSTRQNPFITIMKGVFSNPIVVMTVIGIIWNFAFNHTIPLPIAQMVEAISDSFPSTALFLLGHSMVGKISTFKGYFVLTPVLLILAKVLILPILLQKIVVMLTKLSAQETQDLSSLGFLYGTIPCAPAAFVYACQYDLSIDIVTSTIIFSTICSAPVMFVSATMATLSLHGFEKVTLYMESTIAYISSISLISCLCLLVMFLISKRGNSPSYGATTYLVLSQLVTSVGGILCFVRSRDTEGILYAQYMMATGGIISSRIWTVFLAVLLFLSQWKSAYFILRKRHIINFSGFMVSFGVAFLLTGCLLIYQKPTASSNPNFQLGHSQVILAAVVTVLCLLVTVVSLVFQHKCRKVGYSEFSCETSKPSDDTSQNAKAEHDQNYRNTEPCSDEEICYSKNSHNSYDKSLSGTDYTKEIPHIYSDSAGYQSSCDLHLSQSAEQRRSSQDSVEQHQNQDPDSEDNQCILKHIMLLIILSLSMVIAFFVCLWKLFLESANGIFVELEFLDIALNYGQGIIYFLLFGLDAAMITPLIKLRRRIQFWYTSLPSRNSSLSEV